MRIPLLAVAALPAAADAAAVSRTGGTLRASAQILPKIWKRRRHGRSLRVKLDPSLQTPRSESGAGPIGSYPRALTLRIRH